MTIEADIQTTLDNYAGLSAFVSDRNYSVRLPQQPTYPNTVISRNSTEPSLTLTTRNIRTQALFSVDVRAETYNEARQVATQVIAAMEAATLFTALWRADADVPYEDDVETYRIAIDFSIWYNT